MRREDKEMFDKINERVDFLERNCVRVKYFDEKLGDLYRKEGRTMEAYRMVRDQLNNLQDKVLSFNTPKGAKGTEPQPYFKEGEWVFRIRETGNVNHQYGRVFKVLRVDGGLVYETESLIHFVDSLRHATEDEVQLSVNVHPSSSWEVVGLAIAKKRVATNHENGCTVIFYTDDRLSVCEGLAFPKQNLSPPHKNIFIVRAKTGDGEYMVTAQDPQTRLIRPIEPLTPIPVVHFQEKGKADTM